MVVACQVLETVWNLLNYDQKRAASKKYMKIRKNKRRKRQPLTSEEEFFIEQSKLFIKKYGRADDEEERYQQQLCEIIEGDPSGNDDDVQVIEPDPAVPEEAVIPSPLYGVGDTNVRYMDPDHPTFWEGREDVQKELGVEPRVIAIPVVEANQVRRNIYIAPEVTDLNRNTVLMVPQGGMIGFDVNPRAQKVNWRQSERYDTGQLLAQLAPIDRADGDDAPLVDYRVREPPNLRPGNPAARRIFESYVTDTGVDFPDHPQHLVAEFARNDQNLPRPPPRAPLALHPDLSPGLFSQNAQEISKSLDELDAVVSMYERNLSGGGQKLSERLFEDIVGRDDVLELKLREEAGELGGNISDEDIDVPANVSSVSAEDMVDPVNHVAKTFDLWNKDLKLGDPSKYRSAHEFLADAEDIATIFEKLARKRALAMGKRTPRRPTPSKRPPRATQGPTLRASEAAALMHYLDEGGEEQLEKLDPRGRQALNLIRSGRHDAAVRQYKEPQVSEPQRPSIFERALELMKEGRFEETAKLQRTPPKAPIRQPSPQRPPPSKVKVSMSAAVKTSSTTKTESAGGRGGGRVTKPSRYPVLEDNEQTIAARKRALERVRARKKK